MDAIKMLLAGQTASNNALLGAVKSGFMKREKADVEPTFNWMGTHTGNDVVKFIREVIIGLFPENEERDTSLALVAAVIKFVIRSDKEKDRKVWSTPVCGFGAASWCAC